MIHYFSVKKYKSKIKSLPEGNFEKESFSKLPEFTQKPRWSLNFKWRFRLFPNKITQPF